MAKFDNDYIDINRKVHYVFNRIANKQIST